MQKRKEVKTAKPYKRQKMGGYVKIIDWKPSYKPVNPEQFVQYFIDNVDFNDGSLFPHDVKDLYEMAKKCLKK